MPLVAKVLYEIESVHSLRDKYLVPFHFAEFSEFNMNCDPIKAKRPVKEFFENIFSNKKNDKKSHKHDNNTNKPAKKEKSKLGKFFNKLFRKK
jgi:hypothetical protein